MEFHCPVCGFAHPEEIITVTHCRQQHPQEGRLIPYTLTTTGNQVQFAGPSCSLSAVVAILSHMEEEKNFHPIIRRSYQSPSKETTQTLVQALGLELPTAPITAIEALAHHDQMIRQLLEAPATTARQCGHCGVNELMEGPSNPGENLGIISVNPNTCESIELTNQILAKTYTTSWTDMEVVCTGERKNMAHRPTPTLITHSKTFGEMVVIDIGTWGNEAVGLKRILHEILLPHGNGTATYKLVGAVIAPTPFHVVAAIPQQTRKRRWDILDGMVRRTVSQSTVDPKTVVMCVYRREEEETYDVLDEEEQDDDLLGIPNPTPRRLMISQAGPQQNSWVDTRGRRAYGSQEEQDERTSTDQVSIFSHDETRELSSPLECPIVGCTASFVGPRRWEKAKSHIYGVHSLEEVREIPGGELI
ncbi:SLACS retrotransposable element (part) [Trypanosoma brucei equiperdum]|uniref:SLACS retrotransposable element (Part) n=1 Tax=Trypanosoma brucei equiperdum TaxID=630700 RepID=A0A3L6KQK9_9TRYP|nr:SLACS retrotransposable element (part) [Trypanosoma brucei equiperdum]